MPNIFIEEVHRLLPAHVLLLLNMRRSEPRTSGLDMFVATSATCKIKAKRSCWTSCAPRLRVRSGRWSSRGAAPCERTHLSSEAVAALCHPPLWLQVADCATTFLPNWDDGASRSRRGGGHGLHTFADDLRCAHDPRGPRSVLDLRHPRFANQALAGGQWALKYI